MAIHKRPKNSKSINFYCSGLFTIKEEIVELGGNKAKFFRIEGIGKSKPFETYLKDRSTERKVNGERQL